VVRIQQLSQRIKFSRKSAKPVGVTAKSRGGENRDRIEGKRGVEGRRKERVAEKKTHR